MSLELIIGIAVALFAGGLVALRRIAPRTKNTKDDAVLAVAEKAAPFVESLDKKKAE